MPISDQTPQVILINDDINQIGLAVSGSIPSGTPGILFAGITNNTTASFLKIDTSGSLVITGSTQIINFPITQSVFVQNSSLPVSVSNFPIIQTVTGSVTVPNLLTASVAVNNIATVTGSITVPNLLSASVAVTNIPTITGSITVPNVVAVHGNNPENSAPAGNPIWIGGYDRNVIRAIRTDISGKLVSTNMVLTGTPVPVTAALIGGKDISGNLQPLAVTTDGYLFVSTSFETIRNNGLPSKIAVIGGISGSTPIAMNVNGSGSVYVNEEEEKTFVLTAQSVQIGNNKSMIALFNSGSTQNVLKIREIWIKNIQRTAVTGIAAIFELFRISGISVIGTSLTSLPYDTNDILPTNVTGSTNSTVTGEAASSFYRWLWSSDEWGPGPLDQEGYEHAIQNVNPVWKRHDLKEKPIILRSNQGIHIKHTVNSTAGSFDLSIVYTQV